MIIHRNLSFKPVIDRTNSKISNTFGVLDRISLNTPKFILIKLYCALIYPYLTYCNIIWGGACTCQLSKIIIFQKRAIRVITASSYLEP